jgi:hypothetical protein
LVLLWILGDNKKSGDANDDSWGECFHGLFGDGMKIPVNTVVKTTRNYQQYLSRP